MDSVSFTEAVANFEAVMERVVANRAPMEITDERGESVILIAARDWSAIEQGLSTSDR